MAASVNSQDAVRPGRVVRGLAGRGKDSFELVANANGQGGVMSGLARRGLARWGRVWQGKDSLSWWRLRECFGLAWLGEERRGEV